MLVIRNLNNGDEIKISEPAIKTVIALLDQKPFDNMRISMKLVNVKEK